MSIRIVPLEPAHRASAAALIVAIQREEYGIAITLADQPDLVDIDGFYRVGRGNFWVALDGGDGDRVVGTIALKDIGNDQAALRKMFVAASHRGRELGVAKALLDTLLAWCAEQGLREVFLGTTERFVAAHRFYEKHGFVAHAPDALPAAFPRMAVDSRFYRLEVEAAGDAFPTLETERLRLREIVAADAPTLFAIHSDVAAMRWFGTDPLTELAQAEKLVETFASWRKLPNPGVRWGIETRADGRLVGTCGLFKWNRGWQSCSLGYELAAGAQGRGLMKEALAAALAWGFVQMALHRVEAQIHPDNAASIVLVRGLGFVEEGCGREAGFWLGEHQDLLQFGLLRREFAAQR